MDKTRHLILASVIIVAVVVVGLWDIGDIGSTLAVSELTDEHIGKAVRVNGTVKAETLRAVDNGSTVLFTLTDGSADMNVSYSEPQPVNLIEGNHVAVTGTMLPDRSISAKQLVTSCPSKYAAENTTLKSAQ
ncbi:MAG: cytochrome c maturation protein CcmE [Methanosarcinales archaeon]|nr:cytochrome c maturation protein CcmE [Methanosarcinales archaeon]MCK4811188.1 cytochrome c maturation protein CcmE [Methanosarcinales archaeon]